MKWISLKRSKVKKRIKLKKKEICEIIKLSIIGIIDSNFINYYRSIMMVLRHCI